MSVTSDNFEIPEVEEAESIKQRIERLDNPHRDKAVLRELYWNRGLSTHEVAAELECTNPTISRWLDKNDLGARDDGDMGAKHSRENLRVERASYNTHKKGHERWTVHDPDGPKTVGVHQLLAIADGADPADVFDSDNHVHHRTGIPWLNLPDSVEVVNRSEHKLTHSADEWENVDGIPMLVTQGDE